MGDEACTEPCRYREALRASRDRDETFLRYQRLEALVSWIDGRCVDFSTTPHATVLAGEIRAAINRYREERS